MGCRCKAKRPQEAERISIREHSEDVLTQQMRARMSADGTIGIESRMGAN